MEETSESPLGISASHRELLDQVLDKWSLHVLSQLCESPKRFNELRRAVPGVSQKSLTNTLRRLERNGVIDRRVLRSRPVAVEYRVAPIGKTMRAPIDALLDWTVSHMPDIEQARERYDQLEEQNGDGSFQEEPPE
ncbi:MULTISPECIES: winged helix-turn-helix transcriptional regulator [Micrococcales]|uniref:winged helix-turn-helix transcriptional regulator n=1 Tax=Micrococcales TaxID=85006 RepID=UPI000FB9BFAD|nr:MULTISPECIES: helix-turn-helix domain-containing protein [Micrococcaceae]MCS3493351.1 DNA-binding HxlR family transcriptional regulator [Arthrobacter sp. JUb119]RWZ82845.1 transcriptional regulator [Glutamicibacter sp. HZAU]TDU20299.1 HxlR family transcriptional regulator [Arthrobacter sp. JUb115]